MYKLNEYLQVIKKIIDPPVAVNKPQLPATGKAGRNLPAAIAVALILGASIAAVLVYLPVLFVPIAIFVMILALREYAGAVKRKDVLVPMLPMWIGSIGMGLCAYVAGTQAMLVAYCCTIVATVTWCCLDALILERSIADEEFLRSRQRRILLNCAVSIFGLSWISFVGCFLILTLVKPNGHWLIMIMIAMVIASDTGGYVVGVLFGKHPMSPKISPSKSWEGFFGSLITTALVAVATLPLIQVSYFNSFILGIGVAIASVIGDLCESLLKRDLGLKDMGNLLPGHGGILDRLDSILVATIVFSSFLYLMGM